MDLAYEDEGLTIGAHEWVPMDYPLDMDPDTRPLYESLARMMGFLNSPYLRFEKRAPDRGFRRRVLRASMPIDPVEVTFVTLRKAESDTPDGQAPPAGPHRVRWIVSGHYRNQWYPTEETHRLIWIAPYVKGPDGAPLKGSVYRVAR